MPLLDLLDDTQLDLDLDLDSAIQCQYGQQDILDEVKCLLDCTHEAHAPEIICQQPASWLQLLKCHGEQSFYCDGHAVAIKMRMEQGFRDAAKDGEDLECFHCDGLFDYEFVRV